MQRSQNSRVLSTLLLTGVLIFALLIRLQGLVTHAFVLDESWTLEISTGRGSLHQHLPLNQLIPPPPFFSLKDAAPWWHIWSHMEITHPPLYSLLLRGWEETVGDTDYNARLFSVVLSLVAIAMLFDTVRLQSNAWPAFWSSLLMAVSIPQVEHARLVRGYTLLLALALCTINALVRIHRLGPSKRRWFSLWIAAFATLMTHYFCIGALMGLAAWGLIEIPQHRKKILVTFGSVAIAFAALWGPWMWGQRHLFATDDPSTLFLTIDASHHFRQTCIRILTNPVQMLFPISPGPATAVAIAAGILIYAVPFLTGIFRANSPMLLWGFWSTSTVGVVAAMDFARGTSHLQYLRYTILTGPAVFAIICLAVDRSSKWQITLAAIALICCLINLPDVYHHADPDPRNIARDLAAFHPGPQDVLVFAASPSDITACELELLMLSRYLQPMSCKVLVLTHEPDAQLARELSTHRFLFLDTQTGNPNDWVKNVQTVKARTYRNLGNVFVLRPSQGAGN